MKTTNNTEIQITEEEERAKNRNYCYEELKVLAKITISVVILFGLIVLIPAPEHKIIKRTVTSKISTYVSGTAFDAGHTQYQIAFDDGYTDIVKYGGYTCINIGDTLSYYDTPLGQSLISHKYY